MQKYKNVMVISEKQSVVVRGIEKKLGEQGYQVKISTGDPKKIEAYLEEFGIFIFYLAADILEDNKEQRYLEKCCELMRVNRDSLLLIGERKYHEDLKELVPAIRGFQWIDRPLEMTELLNILEEISENDLISSSAMPAAAEDTSDDLMSRMSSGTIDLNAMPVPEVAADIESMLSADYDGRHHSNMKRILIVDDDPTYALMVREWLRDRYKVDIVTAGAKAITFLFKKKVDLILLDYDMPVVDGPKVLEMLRSEPETENIPVVFLTGVGDKDSVKRVVSLKPSGYVLKSISMEALLDYIDQIGI